MQHQFTFKTLFTALVIGTFLASSYSQAWADDVDEAKPLVEHFYGQR